MFLRVVRAAGGKGVRHEYVRVVEAFRQNGKTRHRTVLNLGRKDLLAAHLDLDKLMRLLHGEAVPDRAIREENVSAVAAWAGDGSPHGATTASASPVERRGCGWRCVSSRGGTVRSISCWSAKPRSSTRSS